MLRRVVLVRTTRRVLEVGWTDPRARGIESTGSWMTTLGRIRDRNGDNNGKLHTKCLWRNLSGRGGRDSRQTQWFIARRTGAGGRCPRMDTGVSNDLEQGARGRFQRIVPAFAWTH
jgi:hypothetical protein